MISTTDLFLLGWIGISSVVGNSVLTELILCPSFLGVLCGWMWLITGFQLASNNSLSFSALVAFVHISLCCVSALGSDKLELPLLTDQSLIQPWHFPASLEKRRAANHLPPALIASWLHSLFWLKMQLLHGRFLPCNCKTTPCFSIFCVRGVTNQEKTSDAVMHCLWGKSLLEVLYVWAHTGLISLVVGWVAVFCGSVAYVLLCNLQKWFAV